MSDSEILFQLAEERQTNTEYETNLQDYESLQLKIENLELELKERDCKINKLSTDVDLKGYTISSLNLKVRKLEDDLKSKLDDIDSKEIEIQQQQEIIEKQLYEIEEYKKKLTSENISNGKEQRQIETMKSSIISRDNTITELESKLERCKSVIRNLEAKLEKIAHENKKKDEELISMKSQRRTESRVWSPKPDHHSNSDYIEKAETDDIRALREALKKKDEQYKNACSMVQSFILSRKSLERENAQLQTQVEKKDIKIIELQKELKRLNNHHLSGKSYDGLSSNFNNNRHNNSGSPQNRPDYDEAAQDVDNNMYNKHLVQHLENITILDELSSYENESPFDDIEVFLDEYDGSLDEIEGSLDEIDHKLSWTTYKSYSTIDLK